MTKITDIKKVLVIGSGPIVIGQAAEFDYSGTQACAALREEGIEVVLINSNPATIMTDKETADKIYIEPLNVEFVEKIIAKERPDSIVASMGGQTGLNLAVELARKGILKKYNVRVLGTQIESIEQAEDRQKFRDLMEKIKQPIIENQIITNFEQGIKAAQEIGFPVVIRPAYTLGGSGGGIAKDMDQLKEILERGLDLSPVGQVILERSIGGWKEIEYEVIRDSQGNCIIVCNMENIDPVGVHTGDSMVVAPSQTLSDKEYQMLRTASINIANALDIRGGCNVQYALNPNSFEYCVIEVNPRVSRSSALASKATGYPIARVAAKISAGYNLDEIRNTVTGQTYACFEPALDYVVTKIPRWPFDKFTGANRELGTKMMATGEVMAISNSFEASFLKALRSLEINQYNFEHPRYEAMTTETLLERITIAHDERIFALTSLLRRGIDIDTLHKETLIDKYFLNKFKDIVDMEEELKNHHIGSLSETYLLKLKKSGFTDKTIASMTKSSTIEVSNLRKQYDIIPTYKMVDTCAGEFEALSPYYYSTYDNEDEVEVSNKNKVIVVGSGPIRIGQGIEFDYCSVHAVKSLAKEGIETIIVNNNPETVSTDFDIADKLYFEPLTEEDILNIIEKEKPMGVIVQFGGQTSIKLANFLESMGVNILGTHPKYIDMAEDREKFDELLQSLDIKRPTGKGVYTLQEGLDIAKELGYPVLVRPSYVLGGMGMNIVYNDTELSSLLKENLEKDKKHPVLIDKYIVGREIEVDVISDGTDILIPGIMEHLERAGVHSGDSISIYPSRIISSQIKLKVVQSARMIARAMNIIGMVNIQYIESNDELYIIEVNPRASRTVPYISKITSLPIIDLATKVMLGSKLQDLGYETGLYPEGNIVAVKVPVFSMNKLTNTEISLGPEMKSTGEVLGIAKDFKEALFKGLLAAGIKLPLQSGSILATIGNQDKDEFIKIAAQFYKMGYKFYATKGTAKLLRENDIPSIVLGRINEEGPTVLDVIKQGKVNMIINTPTKGRDSQTDGFKIRRAAVERNLPCFTSLDAPKIIAQIIEGGKLKKEMEVVEL